MELSCHCGNITVSAEPLPGEVASCNCSICRRYAVLWAYYRPDQVRVSFRRSPTVFYLWGDQQVEFHRCDECGCVTHYVTTADCEADVSAVNMRMAEPAMLANLPVRQIDGASY
ncbi:aldehyde-activating protein [Marinobacter hydrocarbonoclasticus]|nr:aldehyde-activating protein [Marinobacter nauticus]